MLHEIAPLTPLSYPAASRLATTALAENVPGMLMFPDMSRDHLGAVPADQPPILKMLS